MTIDPKEYIKFTMCGRGNTCCPAIEQVSDKVFRITDDYKGSVILTREELLQLEQVINQVKSQVKL